MYMIFRIAAFNQSIADNPEINSSNKVELLFLRSPCSSSNCISSLPIGWRPLRARHTMFVFDPTLAMQYSRERACILFKGSVFDHRHHHLLGWSASGWVVMWSIRSFWRSCASMHGHARCKPYWSIFVRVCVCASDSRFNHCTAARRIWEWKTFSFNGILCECT